MPEPSGFTAKDDFLATLGEVRSLLALAAGNEKDPAVYSTLVKAALLFLASKLEAFLEDIMAEFVDKVNTLQPRAALIPESVKMAALDCALDEKTLSGIRRHDATAGSVLCRVAALWEADSLVEDLRVRVKFNYGKHGEAEIIALFAQIGIENIFDACPILSTGEATMAENPDQQTIDVRADINSVTNIRNNILHTDATPNLTHHQVAEFAEHFVQFADKLVETLNTRLPPVIPPLDAAPPVAPLHA